ncbi:hypothetical protein GCM10010112_63100 [Actinoplanes lobatus]|uniref:Uncharacterized protein n=1 Tax=Actinoplanes lobatus TaxID=113568 RepID=A0A7W7MJJ6_9ACTN|nr:hypothetical protein [Actinoplanes lobatus]MBB4752145.1 hypothetical protein [Actinoplanes lobatus]GGN84106.1 hypothetical protein GCM10010112_63100 [Actinoplanes lobatus]GIE44088.1 hypothetical protein Alo02nite_69860 [Actinoplanes lobatus]
MTPRPCTDGTLRHLSVDLDDAPGGDGGLSGLTLCSAPERPVWAQDQWAVDIAYDLYLRDTCVDIATLPPCEKCLRVEALLADPDSAPPLHRRPPRPDFASGFSGDAIRAILRTDIATGASLGRRAAVHLLSFTAIPDQPGFGDLVQVLDLVWDMGDTVRMGQVTDWARVVAFAATADVPDRDRRLIAVAASLDGGPPVDLEPAVTYLDDPPAARRLIEAIAIATGHGDGLSFADS